MELKERFLKYVAYDTQSDESSESFPSTAKQLVLLRALADELAEIGLTEVEMDANGYVVAGENCETSVPGIFVAGDTRTKELRQIITAVADGANAVNSVQKYLLNR